GRPRRPPRLHVPGGPAGPAVCRVGRRRRVLAPRTWPPGGAWLERYRPPVPPVAPAAEAHVPPVGVPGSKSAGRPVPGRVHPAGDARPDQRNGGGGVAEVTLQTLPEDMDLVEVTGRWSLMSGDPGCWGMVTLRPSVARLVSIGTGTVVIGSPLVLRMDAEGRVSARVPATDDPDIQPVDWHYEVTV